MKGPFLTPLPTLTAASPSQRRAQKMCTLGNPGDELGNLGQLLGGLRLCLLMCPSTEIALKRVTS